MIEIIYFVHGTTTDNSLKLSTGWLDGELSDKGIMQGVELAQKIKNQHFDIVFCSDLIRAVESAKLNFYNRDIEIIRDTRLRECNYGDLNGKSSSLVDYSQHIYDNFPEGESLKDVESRIKDFVKFLKENFEGKKIAIVAHRAPQLALEVVLNGKTWEKAIDEDWRKTKSWKPGWTYIIK